MRNRRQALSGIVAIVALIAVLAGATVWIYQTNQGTTIEIEIPPEPPIMAEVAGAVRSPGVYEIRSGARVGDLIIAAGGAALCGDPSAINQARRLNDGEKIEVPNLTININTSDSEQLQKLSGIGPALAGRIIAARPYTVVDDLLNVSGIGEVTLRNIKDGQCRVTATP